MTEAQISVIIPVYQAEKTIRRCLDSIFAQTYPHWAVLAVDDGSKDGSGAILDEYAQTDSRVQVFHQPNGGAAHARNAAIKRLETKYVTFLDSDDWLEPDALEKMLKIAQDTDAQIVQCKFYYDHPNGEQYLPQDSFSDGMVADRADFPKTVYHKMLTGIQLNHVWHSLFESQLMEGLAMPENMVTGEDLYFLIDVFPRASRYAYTAKPLFHYFRRPDGLTGSSLKLKEKIHCNWLLSKKLSASLKNWGMDTPWYHIKAYLRLPRVFVSKAYRMVRNGMMKLKIGG
ncbi:MAG: hypothetical protein DBY45_04020 [Clostridiales bacterium]|nr:MAG: hypothetical protein DBY45_04020 [Clostridiales bacterium]